MYNRLLAVEYALKWGEDRNPKYYDFSLIGGDCTNFVSQCLYYGGYTQNYSQNGWYYIDIDRRAPSWTGVNEFWNFATTNQSNFGVKLAPCPLFSVEIGDVLQLNSGERFTHTLIVTSLDGGIKVTAHTVDRINAPLSAYYYESLRCGKAIIY